MIAQGAVTNEPAHYNTDLDSGRAYRQRMRRLKRLESEVNRMHELGWTRDERVLESGQIVLAIFLWGE